MTTDMDRKIAIPWWRSRRTHIAIVVIVIVLTSTFALFVSAGSKRTLRVSRDTVVIDAVKQDSFHDFTPMTGKVTPHDTIIVGAFEGGQVERVLVRAGDTVVAGQPLMAFRNTQLELDVLDREGRLVESISQLETFQKQLEDARVNNERILIQIDYNIDRLGKLIERRRSITDKGFLSRESFEQLEEELEYNNRLRPLQAQTNERQEKLRIEQTPRVQEEVRRLRKNLEITRTKVDGLIVKAPATGQLIDFNPNVGQNFNRGDRVGEIVPATGFKVTANIDQYYLSRVKRGQIAHAEIGGYEWKLHVDRVYPQVKDGTFIADLVFDGATDRDLLSGETITGRLSLGGDQPALTLRAGPFLEGSGGDWVMVMTSDNRAVRRRVKMGRRTVEQVEILDGLKAGDRVITSNYAAFEKVEQINLTK